MSDWAVEITSWSRGHGKRYAVFFDLRTRTMLGQHAHVNEPDVVWCNQDEPCEGARRYVPDGNSPLPLMG